MTLDNSSVVGGRVGSRPKHGAELALVSRPAYGADEKSHGIGFLALCGTAVLADDNGYALVDEVCLHHVHPAVELLVIVVGAPCTASLSP